jgi:divalent metal cation (Fe/Co/Zn/Cd) transporter
VEPEAVSEAVAAIPGVRAVRDVRSRRTGAGAAVDLVVEVDAHLPTHAAHEITDRVEALLRHRFAVVDATVHVEPNTG